LEVGDGDKLAIAGEWFEVDEQAIARVVFNEAIPNHAIYQAFVRFVRFEINPGLWSGARCVLENTTLNEQSDSADDADSLSMIPNGFTISDDDILAPSIGLARFGVRTGEGLEGGDEPHQSQLQWFQDERTGVHDAQVTTLPIRANPRNPW
jgi:hypothetical protein